MFRLMSLLLTVLAIQGCSLNNIREDDSLKEIFDRNKVEGTFGLFDNGTGRFTIYNVDRFRDSTYTPASTFKIVNSLIGVHTGVINNDSTIIPWDGVTRPIAEWNRDLSMRDAFRASAVPWYQELARRIGKDTMQLWLDSMGYGKQFRKPVITQQNLDTFWLDNSVRVSADEQLGLVKRLYFDQLPFQKRAQRIVKDMMLWEDTEKYQLSYKTGWGFTDKGHSIGWIIGFIEENRHVYCFVLQVESADKNFDMTKVRLAMLKEILKKYGFFEGRK